MHSFFAVATRDPLKYQRIPHLLVAEKEGWLASEPNPSDSRLCRSLDCSGNRISSPDGSICRPSQTRLRRSGTMTNCFLREKREPHGLSFFAEKEGLSELCERCFLDSLCEDRKMQQCEALLSKPDSPSRKPIINQNPWTTPRVFVSGEGGI